ncbi:MAG TPA: iron-sulfur cluster repair di-iron protein [Blastocatellia bacterium]|nr:iron-sulfur cluster repair di-iron protein [Blastocatellia bacterium]
MISSTMKVKEVAINSPQATRVLEKLKIDYCCGGDRQLGEACATAGVELKTLEQMLEETDNTVKDVPPDFQRLSLAELIKHILDKHHVYTKDEMARLEALTTKVVGAHGENHSELLAVKTLLRQLVDDLTRHMFKEEQILFPFILGLEQSLLQNRPAPFAPFGTVDNPIRMMTMEHDTAGEILRELRKLTSDYAVPADGCMSYQTLYQALEAFEQDLHQHIHLENNILFPKAIAMEGV